MTNKILIVMFSTIPAIGEKNTNEVKKVNIFFVIGFDKARTCEGFCLVLYSASSALDPSAMLAH